MQANYVQRLRLTFSKMGPARFIGHLDLSRTLERSFNRAQIPIAYTQGFNRRPRLSLAAALPLGFTSEYELADIWLAKEMDPSIARLEMMRKMAPGLSISRVANVPLSTPSLQSLMRSSSYEVYLFSGANGHLQLVSGIEQILAAHSLPLERKRGRGKVKQYDLRPLIINLKAEIGTGERVRISMELRQSPQGTGRPDDVLAALMVDPHEALIHRTKITLSEG